MAGGTNVDISTGLTLVLATSGFTADVLNVDWSGISRESIETSHMGTSPAGANKIGNKTFMPGDLIDPGEIVMEIHFNPENLPPIGEAAEIATLTWPKAADQSVAGSWSAEVFETEFSLGAPLEEKMTGTLTLKVSGEITQTVGTT